MTTVLYVDDEADLLEIGKVFLELHGEFSVETITDASEALTLLYSKRFDAIISDYQMPLMNGIEFLKQVRGSGNTIPFILFTGRGREEVVIQALNEGADYYLQKGGDPNSLFAELSHKVTLAVQKREADAALEASEERYRAVVEGQTELICRFSPDGILTFVNEAYCRYFNLEKEQCLGTSYQIFMSPDDATRMQQYLATLTVESPVAQIEHRMHLPDGTDRCLQWNDQAIFSKDGQVLEYQSVGQDITSQKKSDAARRESEEQYRVLLDHIQDGAFLSQDGNLLLCNEALASMIGYTKEEIMGSPIPGLIAPEDREMVMDRQRGRLAGNSLQESYEFQLLHKDRITKIPVILSVGAGMYKGRPAVIGTVHNIMQERELAAALQEHEKKYREIYNSAYIGLFTSTPEGRFLSANPQAVLNLGYDSEEDLIKSVTDIATQVYADPKERELAYSLLKTQGFIENFETRFFRKDGSIVWGSISAKIIRGKDGNLVVEGISQDITARKEAEIEL